ncbi:site-specific recombinase XerD [Alteromonadaceae bacterium 2753L.S.0a.02]|nr:site-specific recombinase XerD [Alteromonadaceae bacterium 2753L.S.0a.02]
MATGLPIKKTAKGWYLSCRPAGKYGPQIRRTFARKRDAENFYFSEVEKARSGNYERTDNDNRRLNQLIKDWYTLHGCTLKDGEKRRQKLEALCKRLGNPLARSLTPSQWVEYRNQRIKEKKRGGGTISKNNVNHEQAYLSAVYGRLIKLKNWRHNNPLQGIEKLKLDKRKPFYLELSQITALLAAAEQSKNVSLVKRIKLCLATGARWGEPLKLTRTSFRNGAVNYEETKNSDARTVPISADLCEEILAGAPEKGLIFQGDARTAFENALIHAHIELPAGQLTHVLRHTFASHHVINGGGLKELQELLGHKHITTTMRYAHLAHGSLKQCLTTNPLASLGQ